MDAFSCGSKTHILAVTNQKGGVGKTTTTVNLAQALALMGERVLVVDLDPQGNATQSLGVDVESVERSVADLVLDREMSAHEAIYRGSGLDLIAATPALSRIEREMIGMTNAELRLGRKLAALEGAYPFVLIDTPPTFGPLLNAALNAARRLIVPVDSSYFALMGIKELLAEIEDIREGTNPDLEVLGYLLTLTDQTRIARESRETLQEGFPSLLFRSQIRRCVRLREAPALSRTIFHHAPESVGAEDYLALASEVIERLGVASKATAGDGAQQEGGAHV